MNQEGVFPKTRRTWIGQRLDEGKGGRGQVNRHIMEVYGPCLRVWYLGSSFRVLGEPEDIIHAFFADRLPREDFLFKWAASGKPLRHWLIIGFGFFLRETLRDRKRNQRFSALPDEIAAVSDEDSMDKIFAEVIVEKAGAIARESCLSKGLSQHWMVFLRHRYEGISYGKIGVEFDVTSDRAAVMARTAERHFVSAIRDLLSRDGVLSEEMVGQLQCLLEASRT